MALVIPVHAVIESGIKISVNKAHTPSSGRHSRLLGIPENVMILHNTLTGINFLLQTLITQKTNTVPLEVLVERAHS